MKINLPKVSFVEILIVSIVLSSLVLGFFGLLYFKGKVDYVTEEAKVAGEKSAIGTKAEDLFGNGDGTQQGNDPVIDCTFKHFPPQRVKKSACTMAVECEITPGNWGLYPDKNACLNAQNAAMPKPANSPQTQQATSSSNTNITTSSNNSSQMSPPPSPSPSPSPNS